MQTHFIAHMCAYYQIKPFNGSYHIYTRIYERPQTSCLLESFVIWKYGTIAFVFGPHTHETIVIWIATLINGKHLACFLTRQMTRAMDECVVMKCPLCYSMCCHCSVLSRTYIFFSETPFSLPPGRPGWWAKLSSSASWHVKAVYL